MLWKLVGVKRVHIFLMNILGNRLQVSADTSHLTWWRCARGLNSLVVLLPLLKLRVIVVSTHSCWSFVLVIVDLCLIGSYSCLVVLRHQVGILEGQFS